MSLLAQYILCFPVARSEYQLAGGNSFVSVNEMRINHVNLMHQIKFTWLRYSKKRVKFMLSRGVFFLWHR